MGNYDDHDGIVHLWSYNMSNEPVRVLDAYYSAEQERLVGSSVYLSHLDPSIELVVTELIPEGWDFTHNFEDGIFLGKTTAKAYKRKHKNPENPRQWANLNVSSYTYLTDTWNTPATTARPSS